MNLDYFIKLAKEELTLPEILKELSHLETYAERKKFANKHMEKLGSGSSRIAYKYSHNDKDYVIKIAKNDKGIAQNTAEANPKLKSPYVNEVINHAKDHCWVLSKFYKKINEKEFKDLTGFDFKDFGEAIKHDMRDENISEAKPENYDKIASSELFKELTRVCREFKLLPGDLAKISSYASKDNHPICIDTGLTITIFNSLYDTSNSSSTS